MSKKKASIKIDDPTVADLAFALDVRSPVFYWDSKLPGFGVKVTAHRKVFVAERRVNGKTRRISIDTHPTIKAKNARAKAMELLGIMRSGVNPNDTKRAERVSGMTFGELCNSYLESKQLADNTRRDYRRHADTTFSAWKAKSFLSITRDMAEKLYLQECNRTSRRKSSNSADAERKVTAAQANQAFRFARAVFAFGQRLRGGDGFPLLRDNPVHVLNEGRLWRRDNRRSNFIAPEKLRPVWESLWKVEETGNRATARDFLLLMLFTGLRLNEARLLRWGDVDLLVGSLVVREPKNHIEHRLPLSSYLRSFFARRKLRAGESEWVFPSTHSDGKTAIVEYRDVLNKVCEQSGVLFTPHDLRRSFLTYVSEQPEKYGVYFTKRLANHKVNDVTAGYVGITFEDLRVCMEDVTRYILTKAGALVTRIGMDDPPEEPKPVQKRVVTIRRPERTAQKQHAMVRR